MNVNACWKQVVAQFGGCIRNYCHFEPALWRGIRFSLVKQRIPVDFDQGWLVRDPAALRNDNSR
jgi:hypothetical protein